MVASVDLGWIQLVFDMLMGIFAEVCLRTNAQNTVGMVCWPFRAAGVRADKYYTWRMTGEWMSFKERQ